jgi:nucleotide-binding universal stress UspA family protein
VSTASIVTGTDGSESAERAVAKAAELAAALDATLHIVMSYSDSQRVSAMASIGGMAVDPVGLNEEARTHAEGIVSQSRSRLGLPGVRTVTHVCCGDPAEALMSIAEGEGADMIVVGNRGMAGARRVLGSVPNRVSHHAACCVLIVPTT